MLELNIKCEDLEQARVYLNAPQYHNLISDMYSGLRNACKHGTDADVVMFVDNYLDDLYKAMENSQGAY